jgi:hypothetical protein
VLLWQRESLLQKSHFARSIKQQTHAHHTNTYLGESLRQRDAFLASLWWCDGGGQKQRSEFELAAVTRVFSPSHSPGVSGAGFASALQPAASATHVPPGHVFKPMRAGSVSPWQRLSVLQLHITHTTTKVESSADGQTETEGKPQPRTSCSW